jgi:hypothetical protein
MNTLGKLLLAVALAYAGLAASSFIGCFIVGVVGAVTLDTYDRGDLVYRAQPDQTNGHFGVSQTRYNNSVRR